MIPKAQIEKAMGISIPVSTKMDEALRSWIELYTNESYWLIEDTVSLELASGIASKTAKFITNNGKSWITGTERAAYLQEQYSRFMTNIRTKTELACALGGVVFKPYLLGRKINVETITADRFFPVAFSPDGEMTAAVFPKDSPRVKHSTLGLNIIILILIQMFTLFRIVRFRAVISTHSEQNADSKMSVLGATIQKIWSYRMLNIPCSRISECLMSIIFRSVLHSGCPAIKKRQSISGRQISTGRR